MALQIQLRRGTTVEHSSFTGAVGEVTVDTSKNMLVIHDGVTLGGHPVTFQSLGVGQTWQNMTASRLHNTTYTNSSGKPIMVFVTFEGTYARIAITVGGVLISTNIGSFPNTTTNNSVTFLVPNGMTYKVELWNLASYSWMELR